MRICATTIMDDAALQTLAAWLSPAWPTGAFAFSQGLEWAIADGAVTDAEALRGWIADCLAHGSGRADAILLAAAFRDPASDEIAALAAALAPSAERLAETEGTGAAFAAITGASFGPEAAPAPYPVALGRAAAAHALPLGPTLTLFLQSYTHNLLSVGVRLIPIGQTEAAQALAALMPLIRETAAKAEAATLDEIGGCALRADLASMRHETQPVRLFRS